MHRIASASLSLLFVLSPVQGGVPTPGDGGRQHKLESILRIQDLRRDRDPSLMNFLSDRDSVVRERAVLACGSLQDTTALPRLLDLLLDTHRSIQEAAAFAIGQTAIRLSEPGRVGLQDQLLGPRLSRTQAFSRVIEEIGKFGTPSALELILKEHSTGTALSASSALSMSIARFAIRGIASEEAVDYLTNHCHPMELTLWQTVYALQRLAGHPQIRVSAQKAVPLREHPDPLVRMNLALLLGRFRGSDSAISSLQEMATADEDWRVRVNACLSLGRADTLPSPQSVQTYRGALADRNPHVRLAALTGLAAGKWRILDGSGPARDLRSDMEALTRNPDASAQMRGEATITLATLLGPPAAGQILRSLSQESRLLAYQLKGLGLTGDAAALPAMQEAAAGSDPVVNCAALEGAIALAARNPGDTTLSYACRALALAHLNSRDVAVTTTAASALGSEGIRDAASVQPLLKRLSALRAPDEIEAIQEITRTLGALRDTSALPALESLLRSPDAASRAAAREAVREITGVEPATGPDTRGDPPYTDFDFDYLRSLPARPRITVETSRGTIALELDRDAAPFTVMSFLKLALGKKFYQGTTFHRVVPNFVVQGGDPRGDGWGGPGYAIRSEFSPLRFDTGVLGIASSGKDTEGCQFFITHSPQPHLDGRYTVFGRVVAGQDVAEQILVGDRILNVGFSEPGAASPGR